MSEIEAKFKELLKEVKSGKGIDEGEILLLDSMISRSPSLVKILKDEFNELKDCDAKEIYAGRIVTHKMEEPYASYLRNNHSWEDEDFEDW